MHQYIDYYVITVVHFSLNVLFFCWHGGWEDCFLKCEKLKKKKSEQFLHCKKITVWKCYSKNLLDG